MGLLTWVLSFDVLLPIVGLFGGAPMPVVVEIPPRAATVEQVCFTELEPFAFNSTAEPGIATPVGSYCPAPGSELLGFEAGGKVVIIGRTGEGTPTAWAGGSGYTVRRPSRIEMPSAVLLSDQVGRGATNAGPVPITGEFALIMLPAEQPAVVGAQLSEFEELVAFADDLLRWIRRDPAADESVLGDLSRYGYFYDDSGTRRASADELGCGVGDTVAWNATGPIRMRLIGGQMSILFGGRFDDNDVHFCMSIYRFAEVARLTTVPEMVEAVDDLRSGGGSSGGSFSWIVNGAQHALDWSGLPDFYYFAFGRAAGGSLQPAAPNFLVVPLDALRLDCYYAGGERICALDRAPSQ